MAIIQQQDNDRDSFLEQENLRLKSILKSLVSEAEHNQQTYRKFQSLEFDLLHTSSLPLLLDKLTLEFKEKLDIESASLFLFDPYHMTQSLLREVYPESVLEGVKFIDETSELELIYDGNYHPQIRHKNLFLAKQLFHPRHPIKSFLILPLLRNGVVIGSYHLGSYNINRFTSEMSTDFYEHFAQVVSVCIENTINADGLKHLTLTDPLTKTKNRRCLYQSLPKEVARAERDETPLSCLFIDIDHFKSINDNYGHAVGDKALEQVAKVIIPNMRTTDILARFGGEEFAAVLPNCDSQVAKNIAERIRHMVASQSFIGDKGQLFKVTCSVGITTWNPQHHTGEKEDVTDALIRNADDAVYHVKSNGRNACYAKPFSL
ncbi:MAG: sensor domain-containing diguanylate cyclase [Gammaproteobacteria bacterium]|nr:sensor domain-containing diguanylate cyclase [Gammaproteobacteria bacterium]